MRDLALQLFTLVGVLRCAITDRTLWPGAELERQAALVRQAVRWAEQGIDLIQLREKDLSSDDLIALAREILSAITPARTRLIVNSSLEAAIAAQAHGVHLTSKLGSLTPAQIRSSYADAGLPEPLVTISCHNREEVERACAIDVDAIFFAPVFGKIVTGKIVTPAAGLEALSAACRAADPIPVLALGGVTLGRALLCVKAGAAGVAGIRLFLK